jgi:hypothetical protein
MDAEHWCGQCRDRLAQLGKLSRRLGELRRMPVKLSRRLFIRCMLVSEARMIF